MVVRIEDRRRVERGIRRSEEPEKAEETGAKRPEVPVVKKPAKDSLRNEPHTLAEHAEADDSDEHLGDGNC